jgi:hypothetical protein
MPVGARLADVLVVQPLRRRGLAAVLADLEPRSPRLPRAFDERRERVPQGALGQPPPLQEADPPRFLDECERGLPDAGELRDDHRGVGQDDDHFRWLAGEKPERAAARLLLIHGGRQL